MNEPVFSIASTFPFSSRSVSLQPLYVQRTSTLSPSRPRQARYQAYLIFSSSKTFFLFVPLFAPLVLSEKICSFPGLVVALKEGVRAALDLAR